MADRIAGLVAREEEGRELPYRKVLDLRCSSGILAVRLAKLGWQVTGVDAVPQALSRRAGAHRTRASRWSSLRAT